MAPISGSSLTWQAAGDAARPHPPRRAGSELPLHPEPRHGQAHPKDRKRVLREIQRVASAPARAAKCCRPDGVEEGKAGAVLGAPRRGIRPILAANAWTRTPCVSPPPSRPRGHVYAPVWSSSSSSPSPPPRRVSSCTPSQPDAPAIANLPNQPAATGDRGWKLILVDTSGSADPSVGPRRKPGPNRNRDPRLGAAPPAPRWWTSGEGDPPSLHRYPLAPVGYKVPYIPSTRVRPDEPCPSATMRRRLRYGLLEHVNPLDDENNVYGPFWCVPSYTPSLPVDSEPWRPLNQSLWR